MSDQNNDDLEKGMQEAVAQRVAERTEPPVANLDEVVPAVTYRIDGVDLSPAFEAIISKLAPIRNQLIKSLLSTTDRRFAQQRDMLLEYQSLMRAFDVLSGYISPDGRVLRPMDPPDPEKLRSDHQTVDEHTHRSDNTMTVRAKEFSNVPLVPTPSQRRGSDKFDYAPRRYREENEPENGNGNGNGGKSPGFLQRVRGGK